MKIYSWNELHKIGRSRLVQGTIFIPIIGYLILFSDWFMGFVQSESGFDSIWKIYCLYYGLTFIALGALIYNFRCPEIISAHGAVSLYVAAVEKLYLKSNFSIILIEIYQMIQKIKPKDSFSAGVKAKRFMASIKPLSEEEAHEKISKEAPIAIDEGAKIEYLITFYYLNSLEHKFSRCVVSVFYALGFLMVFVPSASMFVEVTGKLF